MTQFPFPVTPGEAGKGEIIGFISLTEGAGATTLACATALYLGKKLNTVLVDLKPPGKVRFYVGLTPDVCAASALDVEGVSNPKDLELVSVDSRRGLFVLPGAPRVLEGARINALLAMRVLTMCKKVFDVTVAVLGPVWAGGWPGVLVSDALFLVAKPDREDLDRFSETVSLVSRLGAGERLCVVANQVGLPGGIRSDEFLKSVRPDIQVPYAVDVREQCNRRYLAPESKTYAPLLKRVEELMKK